MHCAQCPPPRHSMPRLGLLLLLAPGTLAARVSEVDIGQALLRGDDERCAQEVVQFLMSDGGPAKPEKQPPWRGKWHDACGWSANTAHARDLAFLWGTLGDLDDSDACDEVAKLPIAGCMTSPNCPTCVPEFSDRPQCIELKQRVEAYVSRVLLLFCQALW
mmetsp:Transcript_13390/g.41320  ORF Transcript_13390/g.41320 Transcript_13390/m.41320 type:complete len:161 (+) Transcript_13390:23-505(+)